MRQIGLTGLLVLLLCLCMSCESVSSQQQFARFRAEDKLKAICNTLEVGKKHFVSEYSCVVDSSSAANAYCKSDGTIVVCEGMMRLFKGEDEIAAVVAHEMGHLIARHKGCQTPEKEIEADKIGLELMMRAGYAPDAAVGFWTRYYERFGWWEGNGTHQEPHERVEMLVRIAQECQTGNAK